MDELLLGLMALLGMVIVLMVGTSIGFGTLCALDGISHKIEWEYHQSTFKCKLGEEK